MIKDVTINILSLPPTIANYKLSLYLMGIDSNAFLFNGVFASLLRTQIKMLFVIMKNKDVLLSTHMKILTRKIFLKFYSASQGSL